MTTSFPQIAVLDTPEGETALLTAIINARPVGMGKHWAMVSILLYLEQILGEGRVTGEEVWNKLRTLYDLDLLDEDSDLNTPNDALPSEDDPSSSTSSRKRRRRLSTTAAPADTSLTYDRSNITKSDFNLLNKRAFQEEFAKRRKSSHSPSPSPFLTSSMPLEPDEDEEEEEEDGDEGQKDANAEDEEEDGDPAEDDDANEDTLMQGDEDDAEEEEEDEEESKPSRGRRSVSRGRPPKKASIATKKAGGRKPSGTGNTSKAGRRRADSDDAISETASTLSELSEDGDASRARAAKDEEDAEQDEQEDDVQEDEEENVDQDDEADETGSGTEPDIGPDDTPFKTPKGIKKRQQQSKGKRSSTVGADEDEENEQEISDAEKSPTSTRKGTRGPKSTAKVVKTLSRSKNAPEPSGTARGSKSNISKPQNGTATENSKRKLDGDRRRK